MTLSDLVKDERGSASEVLLKTIKIGAVLLFLYTCWLGIKAFNKYLNTNVEERDRGFGSKEEEKFVVIGGEYYYNKINKKPIEEAFSEKKEAAVDQKIRPGYKNPTPFR